MFATNIQVSYGNYMKYSECGMNFQKNFFASVHNFIADKTKVSMVNGKYTESCKEWTLRIWCYQYDTNQLTINCWTKFNQKWWKISETKKRKIEKTLDDG